MKFTRTFAPKGVGDVGRLVDDRPPVNDVHEPAGEARIYLPGQMPDRDDGRLSQARGDVQTAGEGVRLRVEGGEFREQPPLPDDEDWRTTYELD